MDDQVEDERDEDGIFNLENFDAPIKEWVAQERPRAEIKRRFCNFLETFVDANQNAVHLETINQMCSSNGQSLEISYQHLSQAAAILAIWLADHPKDMLQIYDEAAMQTVLKQFPAYDNIHPEIHVRVKDLPIADSLRDLRQQDLNALIKVSGVVTRRTSVFPQLRMVKFTCQSCNAIIGPFKQSDKDEIHISNCPECNSRGPFLHNSEHTIYRNYQKVTLQETPGTVPAGRVPRYKDVVLLADLVDLARPGEEIEVTGVYMNTFEVGLNLKQGQSVSVPHIFRARVLLCVLWFGSGILACQPFKDMPACVCALIVFSCPHIPSSRSVLKNMPTFTCAPICFPFFFCRVPCLLDHHRGEPHSKEGGLVPQLPDNRRRQAPDPPARSRP
jgi:DNA replication licensing factor MCM2